MLPIDIFSLIPDELKQQVRDSLVDFISGQAKKYLNDEVSGKVMKLRSDAAFRTQFEGCLQRAVQRFVNEYELEDEDLVHAISQDKHFFLNQEIQTALLQIIRKPGIFLVDENETITQSFESVLPERRNRQRVDRAIGHLLKCLAQEAWHLPELQPIYSLQFQRITAESARQQVELQKAQLLTLTEMNAGVRDALLQLTTAMEKRLLTSSAEDVLLPRPRPYHNLPRPDYNRFVGREEELSWLRQRLMPSDRAWQIAITGIGGVGKSALALTIAHECRENFEALPPEERFDAIIWISAKEEILTAHGKEKAGLPELILRTLEDVYTAIARTLEREDISRALPKDQGYMVEKALREQRTLLIMDNLESVTDERIKPFLRNLPAPTKAIITSREWLDVADVLILKGMNFNDANALMSEEMHIRQVSLGPSQKQRIYDLTAGLPLPIKLAMARIAGGESFAAVERWLGNAVGDLPEYCIQGQAELAKKHAENTWKLLLACSLFDRSAGVSREMLGYVADLSIADRDDGLSQLQHLCLINRMSNDRFWVLPIVQRYSQANYSSNHDGPFLTSRWLNCLGTYAQEKGIDLEWQFHLVAEFSSEYPNLLDALRWARSKGDWDITFRLAEGIWAYLHLIGLYSELDEILDAADDAARQSNDPIRNAKIHLQRGKLAYVRGHFDQIEPHLKEAESIALPYKDYALLGEIWWDYLVILLLQHRFVEAENLATKLYDTGKEIGNPRLMFYGAYRLSSLETFRKNYGKAKEWIDIAERWGKETNSERTSSEILYRRAAIADATKDFVAAERYLLDALALNAARGERRFVAQDKYQLARVYKQMGNLHLSRKYAEEAFDDFERLGMKSHKETAIKWLKELEGIES